MHVVYYASSLRMIRRAVKYFLVAFYPMYKLLAVLPKVNGIEAALESLGNLKLSLVRLGDDELFYISDKRDLPFQKQDEMNTLSTLAPN